MDPPRAEPWIEVRVWFAVRRRRNQLERLRKYLRPLFVGDFFFVFNS
jgi:hypothetical protein